MTPTSFNTTWRIIDSLTIMTTRKRSLASALTYRVVSTILLMVLSYLIAGQLVESIAISVSFAIFATILFYANDRAWERTDWGRKENGEGSKGV